MVTYVLDDFSLAAFLQALPDSLAEQDLCLRLEVLLVKRQDRNPYCSAVPPLVEELNRLGHHLQSETVPGLDHFFEGPLDGARVLEVRGVGDWFSVRVRHNNERG